MATAGMVLFACCGVSSAGQAEREAEVRGGGTDLRYIRMRASVDANQGGFPPNSTGLADCPTGVPVVSGGVSPKTAGQNLFVRTSLPLDDDDPDSVQSDGWSATVANATAARRTYFVHAICDAARAAGGYRYLRSDPEPLPASSARSVSVKCPDGEPVVGGGVLAIGAVSVVNTSRPYDDDDPGAAEDNGWTAFVRNGSLSDGVIRAYAICDRQLGAAAYAYARTPYVSNPVTVERQCPGGASVIGGGVRSSLDNTTINASSPDDGPDGDAVPDDGWSVTVTGDAGERTRVYAICRRP